MKRKPTAKIAFFSVALFLHGSLCHAVDRYVSLTGGNVSPFTSWANAATNIQDAIDVAVAGEIVWVTNGVYANGGKVMAGDLTNRVALDKALTVRSVNGPNVTIIQGQWDSATTNGPGAVRCAWIGDGAGLSGFTLRDGAAQSSGDTFGGGVWCFSTNAELANCVVTNCRSSSNGGGVYRGTLNKCTLISNSALGGAGGGAHSSWLINCMIARNTAKNTGGGVVGSWLYNCALTENSADFSGGGAYGGALVNCTVTANWAGTLGGGVGGSPTATNCIIYFNTFGPAATPLNGAFTTSGYIDSLPLRTGVGNISSDPQLVDAYHLAVTSPCRGAGSSLYTVDDDLDGEPWLNPPSMGCDEAVESSLVGPLSVSLTAAYPEVAAYVAMPLTGTIAGRASRLAWSFGDGGTFTNLSYLTSHIWTNPGDYTVTFTAFNADNLGGVATTLQVHVVPLVSPTLTSSGFSGTNFGFTFTGQPGVTYIVEQATNLVPPVTWQTVQTLSSTGALMQVTDTKATNAARFYRARTQ